MVIRISAGLEQVDVVEPRIRARHEGQSRWQDTGPGLIYIARRQQLRSFGADVGDFQNSVAAELPLHIEIPVLHVGRAQVTLNSECRVGQWKREESGKLMA